ncbi:MAG: DNA recombination protein RmuC [Micrococcales bacterium]|nr:DNA recombination protein RmuC [Micrococcales bacterium]
MELLWGVLGLGVGVALGWLLAGRRGLSALHLAQVRAEKAEALLAASEQHGADRVAALTAQAFAESSDRLLALAQERFAADQKIAAGELASREQAFRGLLDPMTRALDDVRRQLTTSEQARVEGHAALSAQVRAMREDATALRDQTSRLVTALRGSQARGRWGEVQLRRVVEAAGMLDRVDFTEQEHARTDDGALRPDLVVRLAGGKRVVVDAKVPFLGFLEAAEADDPSGRAAGLEAHARQVRTHVDALAAKRYWEQFTPAPEFVVMFVPVESFLSAALEADPTLVEHAFDKQVIIATPISLLALLRTVAYAWRQDALADNAQKVLDVGRELHGRLATMGGHLSKLGRALDSAAGAYNETVGSLERRVLVSARRFQALGVVDTELDAPQPANPRLSAVSAPELVASAEEQVVALETEPRTPGTEPRTG